MTLQGIYAISHILAMFIEQGLKALIVVREQTKCKSERRENMTNAQVEYLKYLEGKRHNEESERETARHDVASEKASQTSAVGSVLKGVGAGSVLSLVGGAVGAALKRRAERSANAKILEQAARLSGETVATAAGTTAAAAAGAGAIVGLTAILASIKGIKDAEKTAAAISAAAEELNFTEDQWNKLRPMDRRYIGDGLSRGGQEEVTRRMKKFITEEDNSK